MLEQARVMQQQLMSAQDNMANIEVEAAAGGGMVRVTATADMKLTSVSIDPDVVDSEDVDMLEDLVLTAVNSALAKANEAANGQVADITGGLDLSSLGNLF